MILHALKEENKVWRVTLDGVNEAKECYEQELMELAAEKEEDRWYVWDDAKNAKLDQKEVCQTYEVL